MTEVINAYIKLIRRMEGIDTISETKFGWEADLSLRGPHKTE
jgi:hypothetical protein